MDVLIHRKFDFDVEINGATDAYVKDGFYMVKRGTDQFRYPVTEIREVIEHGREDRV